MAELFKVTGPNGEPLHGGSGQWPLPRQTKKGWRPGRWRKVKRPLAICSVGLHVVIEVWLTEWLPKDRPFTVWRVEVRGDPVKDGTKYAYPEVRLVEPWLVVGQTAVDLAALLPKAQRPTTVTQWRTLLAVPPYNYPLPSERLVFGVHTLPPDAIRCPAWPTPAALDGRNWTRTITKSRRLLRIPPALDRAVRSGDPMAYALALMPR